MNELRDKEGRTPGQVAIEAWNNYIKKGWDERFESMAQAVLDAFGAQVSQQAIIAAWRAGWDAADIKSYKPETYADSITFAPEREPLPYTAEEVADAVLSAWCNSHGVPPQPGRIDPHGYKAAIAAAEPFCAPPAEPKREPLPYTAEEIADDILRANGCAPRHYPRTRAHTVAAVAKFCAPPASTSKEDDPEGPVYKKGHEPKAIVTAHFTAESQRYPAPSGFAALLAEPLPEDGCYSDQTEPTLDEIRALAAKHGMVLRPLSKTAQDVRKPLPPAILADILQDTVHKEVGRTRLAKTARSLTVQFLAPDARFGSGK